MPDRAGGWRIVADIKGAAPVDPAMLAEAAPPAGAHSTLFLRDALGQRWSALGEIAESNAEWLREMSFAYPCPEARKRIMAQAQWRARLSLTVQELRSDDPLIEAIAHGDLARAPYPAILDVGRTMSTAEILQHLQREAHPSHRAAYIHMLGATGDAAAAAWLDGRIGSGVAVPGTRPTSQHFLPADLELRGPLRIGGSRSAIFSTGPEASARSRPRCWRFACTARPTRRCRAETWWRRIAGSSGPARRWRGSSPWTSRHGKSGMRPASIVALLNADVIADPGRRIRRAELCPAQPGRVCRAGLELPDG